MKDLYIIQCDKTGAFKIGVSKDVNKRYKQLQTGCPYELKIILILKNGANMEKKLHHDLKDFKTTKQNQEWFCFDGLACLPDSIYEKFDLDFINTWWEK